MNIFFPQDSSLNSSYDKFNLLVSFLIFPLPCSTDLFPFVRFFKVSLFLPHCGQIQFSRKIRQGDFERRTRDENKINAKEKRTIRRETFIALQRNKKKVEDPTNYFIHRRWSRVGVCFRRLVRSLFEASKFSFFPKFFSIITIKEKKRTEKYEKL